MELRRASKERYSPSYDRAVYVGWVQVSHRGKGYA